jgi:hypothetical protein
LSILLFLLALAMFVGFGLTVGSGVLLSLVVDAGDANATGIAALANRSVSMIGLVSVGVAAVLGVAAASSLGYPLLSTWLVVIYVCATLIIILGFGVLRPWTLRLAHAAEATDQNSEALKLVGHERARAAGPLVGVLWVIAIAMLVFKP